MDLYCTPSDWLVFSGLAVTGLSWWLMFHRLPEVTDGSPQARSSRAVPPARKPLV